MSEFVKVGTKKDFPMNLTTGIEVNGQEVCVANNNGELTAFHNSCTHAQAQLSDCDVEEGEVSCPLHGARFDVKTGEAKTPPAVRPVQMHEVKLEGDNVFIKLNGN